jgi:hypothetical protein
MSAPPQAIAPNPHTNSLNVYIQIANKMGFQPRKTVFLLLCVFYAVVNFLLNRCLATAYRHIQTYRHRLMGMIYWVCHWDGLRCYDANTKFHDYWIRESKFECYLMRLLFFFNKTTSTVKCPDFSMCKISPYDSNGKNCLN